MKDHTDRQKACSDAVATIQTLMLDWDAAKTVAETKAVWNRIEEKLITMETKANLWDVVRSICIPHGAGVDKPVTEWLEERLAKPVESTSPITAFSEPAGAGDVRIPDAKRDELISALLASLEKSDQRETDFYLVRSFIGDLGLAGACRFCGTTTNRRDCKGLNCCKDRQYAEAPQSTDGGAGDVRDEAMSLRVALDFADNPRPHHTMAAPADTNGELYGALRVLAAAYRSEPSHPAAPADDKCATCNGHGMIGGPSYYAPDEGGDPCPDCDAPSTAAHAGATWKLVPVEPTETMVTAANEVEYCEDGITHGQLRAAINAAPTPSATAAQGATDAKAHTMACDLQAEQTFLGSCYESCDDSGKARWKRLQRVIDHLTAPTPVAQGAKLTDGQRADLGNRMKLAREAGLMLRIDGKFGSDHYHSVTGSWPALIRFAVSLAAPTPVADSGARQDERAVIEFYQCNPSAAMFDWLNSPRRAAAKPVSVDAGGMIKRYDWCIERLRWQLNPNRVISAQEVETYIDAEVERLARITPPTESTPQPVTFVPCTCFDETARKYCAKSRVCSRIEAQGSTGGPNA